jgi:hypothetical protein
MQDAAGRLWIFYTESDGDCVRTARPHTRWPPGGTIKVVSTVNATVSQTTVWTAPRIVYSIFDGTPHAAGVEEAFQLISLTPSRAITHDK